MKNKELKSRKLQERGITLVALVVTIIILLILAGVTLNLALGEGGIFARAKNTADRYQAAQANEVDQLTKFEEMLNTYGNGGSTTGGGTGTENTTTGGGGTETGGGSAGEIADSLEKGDNSALGKKVDISGIITEGKATEYSWQILYADESNIYLIAANYVKIDDCPTTAGGKSLNKNSDYLAGFSNIVGGTDYASIATIKSNADVAKLNSQFFAVESLPDATNNNMKAVGYMLDTNIWAKQFVGESNSKVDYVVGNPSIELLLKAYNKYNGTSYSSQADTTGYKVSTNGSSYSTTASGILKNTDGTYNTAIVLNNTDVDGNAKNTDYMWVASPSAAGTACLMRVAFSGDVDYDPYTGIRIYGFRPVVCLDSSVVLEKISDTVYKAK